MLSACLAPQEASPLQSNLPSIREYYTQLSPQQLGLHDAKTGEVISKAQQLNRIEREDLDGMYLEINTLGLDAFEAELQIALFRKTDGTPILATASILGDRTEILTFFENADGSWVDATQLLMPEVPMAYSDRLAKVRLNLGTQRLSDCASGTYRYLLPQGSGALRAVAATDCFAVDPSVTLFEMRFDGMVFRLHPSEDAFY